MVPPSLSGVVAFANMGTSGELLGKIMLWEMVGYRLVTDTSCWRSRFNEGGLQDSLIDVQDGVAISHASQANFYRADNTFV